MTAATVKNAKTTATTRFFASLVMHYKHSKSGAMLFKNRELKAEAFQHYR
jgi:hypothetical protein